MEEGTRELSSTSTPSHSLPHRVDSRTGCSCFVNASYIRKPLLMPPPAPGARPPPHRDRCQPQGASSDRNPPRPLPRRSVDAVNHTSDLVAPTVKIPPTLCHGPQNERQSPVAGPARPRAGGCPWASSLASGRDSRRPRTPTSRSGPSPRAVTVAPGTAAGKPGGWHVELRRGEDHGR